MRSGRIGSTWITTAKHGDFSVSEGDVSSICVHFLCVD